MSRYILMIKKTEDKKTRYITAKKLAVMFRQQPFSEWKHKLDNGSTIVMSSESIRNLETQKESLELAGAKLEITTQKSIGGKSVF